ncbi:MAG: isopentenyl phosphate kinase [Phycisphaeraceae bacterium JB051]
MIDWHLIKLGGSVITHPDRAGKFYACNVQRIAREIAAASKPCILVHGTGHVGKPPAIEHGYADTGIISANNTLLSVQVRLELRHLHQHVLRALLDAGIRALPMDTATYFNDDGSDFRQPDMAVSLKQAVEAGCVPVFHGDMVQLPDHRFKVVSSDAIMSVLARYLKPKTALLLTDVEGVYAADDVQAKQVIDTLTPANLKKMQQQESDQQDVSGGMTGKVKHAMSMAEHCQQCIIASGLKAGVISRLLAGESGLGTRVLPEN